MAAGDITDALVAELGLRLEDAGANVFTTTWKLNALNKAQFQLAQMLHVGYLCELEYSESALDVSGGSYAITSLNPDTTELAPALTAAYWDTVAGWDYSGSSLNHSSDGAGATSPVTALSITTGKTYKVIITLSACTVGNCTYTLGGTAGTTLSAATTYTDYITATTDGDLIFTPSAASARFNISAVSVKECDGVFRGAEGILKVSVDPGTAGTYYFATKVDIKDIKRSENTYLAGSDTNILWYIFGSSIYILCTTYPATLATIYYLKKPTAMTTDVDPVLNKALHPLMCTLAEAICWALDGKLDRRQTAYEMALLEIDTLNARYKPAEGIGTRGREILKK